ncbi:MAG: hypothetical protein ACRDJU_13380 [Actinomycetota bacterium]
MTEGAGESMESGCCGGAGHGHAHDHEHEHADGGMCSAGSACSTADGCATEGDACCGGHSHDLFAFPTTTEIVSIPAVTLAGVLDLIEKLAPDMVSLQDEVDYQEGQRILSDQAPQLVALRAAFLQRMTELLNEVGAAQGS